MATEVPVKVVVTVKANATMNVCMSFTIIPAMATTIVVIIMLLTTTINNDDNDD